MTTMKLTALDRLIGRNPKGMTTGEAREIVQRAQAYMDVYGVVPYELHERAKTAAYLLNREASAYLLR